MACGAMAERRQLERECAKTEATVAEVCAILRWTEGKQQSYTAPPEYNNLITSGKKQIFSLVVLLEGRRTKSVCAGWVESTLQVALFLNLEV